MPLVGFPLLKRFEMCLFAHCSATNTKHPPHTHVRSYARTHARTHTHTHTYICFKRIAKSVDDILSNHAKCFGAQNVFNKKDHFIKRSYLICIVRIPVMFLICAFEPGFQQSTIFALRYLCLYLTPYLSVTFTPTLFQLPHRLCLTGKRAHSHLQLLHTLRSSTPFFQTLTIYKTLTIPLNYPTRTSPCTFSSLSHIQIKKTYFQCQRFGRMNTYHDAPYNGLYLLAYFSKSCFK